MGRRRCCCGCAEYEDAFDRPDSDDLTYWREESGDWEIASGELSEAGNSGAIAIYDTKLRTQWMKASIVVVDEQVGDIYKLYVSWLDAANHVYAMYEVVSTTAYRISLHSVLAGVDTEVDVLEENYLEWPKDHRSFSVCNSAKIAAVSLDDSSLCTIFAGPIGVDTEAKYAGVGHENAHTTTFDDWYVSEVDYTKKNKDGNLACPCFGADCKCENYVLGPELHGVYQGEGDCDTLDGIEFTLSRGRCGADASAGMFTAIQDGTCLDQTLYEILCAAGGVENWILHISSRLAAHGCGYEGDVYLAPEADSTCDPLYLRYCLHVANATGLDNCGDCLPCGQGGGADCDTPGQPPCPRVDYCIIITE